MSTQSTAVEQPATTRLDPAKVKTCRLASGWTQLQLAAAAGCHYASVQRVEGGKSKHPSADLRRRLTRALGLPEDGLDMDHAA